MTVHATIGKEEERRGGRYLEDVEEAARVEDDFSLFSVEWVKQTFDAETETRPWKDSVRMVGISENV
jgi:hypothetical protein